MGGLSGIDDTYDELCSIPSHHIEASPSRKPCSTLSFWVSVAVEEGNGDVVTGTRT